MSLLTCETMDPGAARLKLPPDVKLSFTACREDLQASRYTDLSIITVSMGSLAALIT